MLAIKIQIEHDKYLISVRHENMLRGIFCILVIPKELIWTRE